MNGLNKIKMAENKIMSKFNEFFSNDPNNDTDAYNENGMLNEYFDMIVKHDYSHMFSDDNRYWKAGKKSENRIKEIIHALCTIVRVDAERLLEDSLNEVKEGYVDGLIHKTIRNWFKPYVENVDNIFTKPNF
jgi:hypothetical protein